MDRFFDGTKDFQSPRGITGTDSLLMCEQVAMGPGNIQSRSVGAQSCRIGTNPSWAAPFD